MLPGQPPFFAHIHVFDVKCKRYTALHYILCRYCYVTDYCLTKPAQQWSKHETSLSWGAVRDNSLVFIPGRDNLPSRIHSIGGYGAIGNKLVKGKQLHWIGEAEPLEGNADPSMQLHAPLRHTAWSFPVVFSGRVMEFGVVDGGNGNYVCTHKALPEGQFFLEVFTTRVFRF